MKIELLIHGVLSNGQSYWKKQDTNYLDLFYKKSEVNVVMRAEVRKGDKGIGTYYTYARYNNITPKSNRPGAYFAMTVWIEEHIYTDITTMYNILDRLFYRDVVGTILSPTSEGYQYTCDDFSQKHIELDAIEKKFGEMLKALVNTKTEFIPISQVASSNDVLKINPADANQQQVLDLLKQGTSILASKEFSYRSAVVAKQNAAKEFEIEKQQHQTELENVKTNTNNLLQQKERQLVELQQQKAALEAKQSQLQKEKQALEQEKQRLTNDYNRLKTKKDLSNKLEEINEPIQYLARQLAHGFSGSDYPHGETRRHGHSVRDRKATIIKTVEKIAIALAFLLLLGGVGYSYYAITTQIESLEKQVTSSKVKSKTTVTTKAVAATTEATETTAQTTDTTSNN